jgi:hypothetical protein
MVVCKEKFQLFLKTQFYLFLGYGYVCKNYGHM